MYSITSTLSSLFYNTTNVTGEHKLITISNTLNILGSSFNKDGLTIHTPRICTTGLQSAGKTTVINNIIGIPILPTAAGISTLRPTHIEMYNSHDNPRVVFGEYKDVEWQEQVLIPINIPEPSLAQIDQIKAYINSKMGLNQIIAHPIYVRIYSPNVPNLTYIDTPGIIAFPDIQGGQTPEMVTTIKDIAASYISDPSTIIFCVVAARPDINADFGMGFVKQFDPDCKRTICAMTKVDTVNMSLINYCSQSNISQHVGHGYYLLRNRDSKELCTLSLQQGIKREAEFFATSEYYKSASSNEKLHMGIDNLRQQLSVILLTDIKRNIPNYRSQLSKFKAIYEAQLNVCGTTISLIPSDRLNHLNVMIAEIAQTYIDICKSNTTYANNVLSSMNLIFEEYRKNISQINPFTPDIYTDKYISDVMRNSDGVDMASLAPSIKIISYCLRDPEKKCISNLITPSIRCVNEITDILRTTMFTILNQPIYSRFVDLSPHIRDYFESQILNKFASLTIERITDDIKSEGTLTYTNDPTFIKEWRDIMSPGERSQADIVRLLLSNYYSTIIKTLQKTVPNKIMYYLYTNIITNLTTELVIHIVKTNNLHLLNESPEIEDQRTKLHIIITKITSAISQIDSI